MHRTNLARLWLLVGVIASTLAASRLPADDPVAAPTIERTDEQLMAEVSNLAKNVRRKCDFLADLPSGTKLVPHPEPVLRWSNPTAGRVFGNVCVWSKNGRPLVVACIYQSPNWSATLEVCSLSDGKLVGQVGAHQFWMPDVPGLNRQPLRAADKPADSAAVRLVQMRRLAGEFAAHLEDTRGTDRVVPRQLRMLTQPIFRYPPPSTVNSQADYVDGALFAFVEGTDPEVLLVLEARRAGDSVQWEYGLARMNRDAVSVAFRDTSVWSVPYLENPLAQKTQPYTYFSLEQPPLNQLSIHGHLD